MSVHSICLLNGTSSNWPQPNWDIATSNWDNVIWLAKKVPASVTASLLKIPATILDLLPAICFPEPREIRSIVPIHILEEQTFKSANLGAVALFAHQNRFVHLGIALGQYFLDLPQIGINITHAGIVSEKSNDRAISLYEIPGPGFLISKMDYALEDLKLNAQLLFFDPHMLLPEQERGPFINHLLQISKTFIEHAGQNTEHKGDYNLRGIARLPIESATFLKSDWITLLDDLVEYHLLAEASEGSYTPKHTKYFCSEFVLKKMHLARLMQKYPEICEQIKSTLKTHNLTDAGQRAQFTERLYQECMENGTVEELLKDPLFFMPSRSAMPAHLIQFAETHHLPLYRVANPDPESENELEVRISRWLYQSSAVVKDAVGLTYRTALAMLSMSIGSKE